MDVCVKILFVYENIINYIMYTENLYTNLRPTAIAAVAVRGIHNGSGRLVTVNRVHNIASNVCVCHNILIYTQYIHYSLARVCACGPDT